MMKYQKFILNFHKKTGIWLYFNITIKTSGRKIENIAKNVCLKYAYSVDRVNFPSCFKLLIIYAQNKHSQKKDHIYIGREDDKNILSYVDFQDFVISYYNLLG